MREKYAILVAAGKGLRMGEAVPKQFLQLSGKPLLCHTIHAFLTAFADIRVILVLPENAKADTVLDYFSEDDRIVHAKGGATRFESVKNGLQLTSSDSVIFVHDGVRPLVSPGLIRACYHQALEKGSAIPALPLKDSIRQISQSGNKAVDRTSFRSIQTPQTFLSEILLPAFEQSYKEYFTDEATVVEASGKPVCLIEGEEENIKITRPFDFFMAGQLLSKRNKA